MDIRGFLKHNDFTGNTYFESNEKGNFIKTDNGEIRHLSEIPVKSEGQKEDKPILFTTSDGYGVKKGDVVYTVGFTILKEMVVVSMIVTTALDKSDKVFKEEKNALTSIAENRKVYSYADIKTEFDKSIVQLEQKAKDEFDGWKMSGIMDCKRTLENIIQHFKPTP